MTGNVVVSIPAALVPTGRESNNRKGSVEFLSDLFAAFQLRNHNRSVHFWEQSQQFRRLLRTVGSDHVELCGFYHQLANRERLLWFWFSDDDGGASDGESSVVFRMMPAHPKAVPSTETKVSLSRPDLKFSRTPIATVYWHLRKDGYLPNQMRLSTSAIAI